VSTLQGRSTTVNAPRRILESMLTAPDGRWAAAPLGFVSLVGTCKFNYSAAQMTTHGAA
jgi:hypothetical protein